MIGKEYKAPLIAMACVLFIGYQLYSATEFIGSDHWIPTTARIQSSYRGHGRGRHARIRYTYSYRGKTYEGSRVRFGLGTSNSDVSEYPTGSTAEVWINPDKPACCSLKREYSNFGIILFGLSVSVLLGTVGYILLP